MPALRSRTLWFKRSSSCTTRSGLLNPLLSLLRTTASSLQLFSRSPVLSYVPNPIFVIIDVQPKELGIPTNAYYAVEEVKENVTQKSRKNATQKSRRVFVHVPSENCCS